MNDVQTLAFIAWGLVVGSLSRWLMMLTVAAMLSPDEDLDGE